MQELHKSGWDLELSSDLARDKQQASTLFFRKNSVEREGARVVCVAPCRDSLLTLLNHDERQGSNKHQGGCSSSSCQSVSLAK